MLFDYLPKPVCDQLSLIGLNFIAHIGILKFKVMLAENALRLLMLLVHSDQVLRALLNHVVPQLFLYHDAVTKL